MEETEERKPLYGGIQNNYYGTVGQVVNVQSHKKHRTHKNFKIGKADISVKSPGNNIAKVINM